MRLRAGGTGRSGPSWCCRRPPQGRPTPATGSRPAGDVGGDAAVAWVQGARRATEIVADAAVSAARAAFGPIGPLALSRSTPAVLSWTWSRRTSWGPITYTVTLDGAQVGQTDGDARCRCRRRSPNGPHTLAGDRHQPGGRRPGREGRDGVRGHDRRRCSRSRVPGARAGSATRSHVLSYADPPPAGVPVPTPRGSQAGDRQVGRRDIDAGASPGGTGLHTLPAGPAGTRSPSSSPTAPATGRRSYGAVTIIKPSPSRRRRAAAEVACRAALSACRARSSRWRSALRRCAPRRAGRDARYVATAADPGRALPRRADRPLPARRQWLYRADPERRRASPQGWWRNVASTDGLVAGDDPELLQRRRLLEREHGRLRRLVPARFHAPGRRLRRATCRSRPAALDHPLRVGQLPRHRLAQRPAARQPRRAPTCRSSST